MVEAHPDLKAKLPPKHSTTLIPGAPNHADLRLQYTHNINIIVSEHLYIIYVFIFLFIYIYTLFIYLFILLFTYMHTNILLAHTFDFLMIYPPSLCTS